ncbi:MAG: hypothetical protein ACOX7V_06885 [Methanoculleus thermophilus]
MADEPSCFDPDEIFSMDTEDVLEMSVDADYTLFGVDDEQSLVECIQNAVESENLVIYWGAFMHRPIPPISHPQTIFII